MEDSRLNNLPPELRDRIWELAVAKEGHISIQVRTGKPLATGIDLRYMRVCRQMLLEIRPIFYQQNGFTIVTKFLETEGNPAEPEARKAFAGIQAWLAKIGQDNASRLHQFRIDLGWYSVDSQHDRITEIMNVAKEEIQALQILPRRTVLRAVYCIEMFPPIIHIVRYVDIPLNDRKTAERILETTTSNSKEKLPPYTFNRDVVHRTMDMFQGGICGIVREV